MALGGIRGREVEERVPHFLQSSNPGPATWKMPEINGVASLALARARLLGIAAGGA